MISLSSVSTHYICFPLDCTTDTDFTVLLVLFRKSTPSLPFNCRLYWYRGAGHDFEIRDQFCHVRVFRNRLCIKLTSFIGSSALSKLGQRKPVAVALAKLLHDLVTDHLVINFWPPSDSSALLMFWTDKRKATARVYQDLIAACRTFRCPNMYVMYLAHCPKQKFSNLAVLGKDNWLHKTRQLK